MTTGLLISVPLIGDHSFSQPPSYKAYILHSHRLKLVKELQGNLVLGITIEINLRILESVIPARVSPPVLAKLVACADTEEVVGEFLVVQTGRSRGAKGLLVEMHRSQGRDG